MQKWTSRNQTSAVQTQAETGNRTTRAMWSSHGKALIVAGLVTLGSMAFASAAQAAPLMEMGSRGTDVRVLQTELSHLGYAVGPLDGIFGPKTLAAVKSFQRNDHLRADGMAGPLTQSTLDKLQAGPASERSAKIQGIVTEAKKFIGTPYVWGGTSPSGFDCSGFTQYVYASQGIELPRVSRDQAQIGSPVSASNLQPGDLVFFSFAGSGVIDHVGIYLGNGQFISATTHKGVAVYPFSPYWRHAFKGARRVL
ncbi:murein DD-endopeptidase MepS/murein LD-carboxypeptidase precursor [Peptococcaceae bacterium CEB3]|nr:murein DD-endopeptidase MepS/murein LD-carboxypeptidase precursor [Peptococcaceae bacterium CEB3]